MTDVTVRVTPPMAAALRVLLDGEWHPRRQMIRTILIAASDSRHALTSSIPLSKVAHAIQRPTLAPRAAAAPVWNEVDIDRSHLPARTVLTATRILRNLEDRGWVTIADGHVQISEHCLNTLYGNNTSPRRPTRDTNEPVVHSTHPSGAHVGDNTPKPWTLAIVQTLATSPTPLPRDELVEIAEQYVPDQRAIEVAMTRATAEVKRGKRANLPTEADAAIYGRRYIARQAVLATTRNGLVTRDGDLFHATDRLREAVNTPSHPLAQSPGEPVNR